MSPRISRRFRARRTLRAALGVAQATPPALRASARLWRAESVRSADAVGCWLLWSVLATTAAAACVLLLLAALGVALFALLPEVAAVVALPLAAAILALALRARARAARRRIGFPESARVLRRWLVVLTAPTGHPAAREVFTPTTGEPR